jgi:hypothetical protein
MRFSKLPPQLVGALVGLRRDELVDQVAFRAHDLDAVVAGFCARRAQRRSRAMRLRMPLRERARREAVDRRRSADGATLSRMVAVAAGVQDLQAILPPAGARRR